MVSKGFYFSSQIEKNKGDKDFKNRLIDHVSENTLFADHLVLSHTHEATVCCF